MAKRELSEINAGSMADIAFLLLIFFLVTTTMDQDSGILRQLPPIVDLPDPDVVKKRNVFEVLVNADDQLLVEGEYMEDVANLKDATMLFLTNSGVFTDEDIDEDMTVRVWVRKSDVIAKISETKGFISQDPDNASRYKSTLRKFESKLDAINYFGEYKELTDLALISLKNDNGTSYDMYIQIQNELTSALNQLRDDLVSERFGKTYLDLNDRDVKDKRIIKAVRQIFPQRVSEAEPNAQ
ncbi:MAG: biopolymer transport protein ExbD [Patiriisocius sp.]|jgi:biopolymer transport protein ExbD